MKTKEHSESLKMARNEFAGKDLRNREIELLVCGHLFFIKK
jgi:hypothetical protein